MIPCLQNFATRMFFALSLKADIENMQMELINFQCDTNLNQTFSETNLQEFFFFFLLFCSDPLG
jgi:hypothetical protein